MRAAALPEGEGDRLLALEASGLLGGGAEAEFDDITRLLAEVCHAPIALVSLIDADRQWVRSAVGVDVSDIDRNISFCAHAILGDGIFEVSDTLTDERFRDSPLVTGAPRVRWYAGVPLRTADGFALGTLCALDHQPRHLTPLERSALSTLGRLAMAQVELHGRLQRAQDQAQRAGAYASEALDSEERLRRLLESIPDQLLSLGRDGQLRSIKAEGDGRLLIEVGGSPIWERLPPALAAELLDRAARARATGAPQTFVAPRLVLDGAGDAARPEPGARDHEVRLLPGADEDLLVIARDISDRLKAEHLRNEFISVVSHELRTPLTSIRGSLGLLEGGAVGALPDAILGLIRIARTNTDRLIRLTNDILDLEKIEAGKQELRLFELFADAIVRTAIDGLGRLAEESGVEVQTEVPPRLTFVGDADRVVQVLINLISNALRFAPVGSRVVVRAARAEAATGSRPRGRVRFSVEDRGPGVDPQQEGKLFSRFSQLDATDARSRGGTGLGLAISKVLVEQHGGSIGFDPRPGGGSVFWFELPATDERPPALVADESRHSVLLVEDDAALYEVMRRLLGREGFRVVRAATLLQAREACERVTPAAVLLDAALPDGDGLTLIDWLRRRPATRDCRVVVVSGRPPDEGAIAALPVFDWLVKPVEERHLLTTLRRAIRRPGPPRALVVEDDDPMRAVLTRTLRQIGVECIEARTGAEAVHRCRAEPPDLIVLDVGLPTMDGFEVVDLLRQEKARTTPLLIYTGRSLSPAERDALTLGETRLVRKAAASEGELRQAIHDLVGDLLAVQPAAGGPS